MTAVAVMPSPLRGASGNIEFLGHFKLHSPDAAPVDAHALAAAVEEAHR
jgi:hypothetical protein